MKTPKQEEIDGSACRDLTHARSCIGDFIDRLDNRTRLHSALDYRTPTDFETQPTMVTTTLWTAIPPPTATPTTVPFALSH
jgi:hypothetical protein